MIKKITELIKLLLNKLKCQHTSKNAIVIDNLDVISHQCDLSNRCCLVQQDGLRKNIAYYEGLNIQFQGYNNYIEIHEPYNFSNSKFICASNAFIIIKQNSMIKNLYIHKDRDALNKIYIGSNFSCNGANIYASWDKQDITIGDHCMMSWGIAMIGSDYHAIIDTDKKKLLEIGQGIYIGNHVWIGMNATVLKSAYIPSNTIIGACSVVCGQFVQENTIIAGNPAKVVKNNINWDRRSRNEYTCEIS